MVLAYLSGHCPVRIKLLLLGFGRTFIKISKTAKTYTWKNTCKTFHLPKACKNNAANSVSSDAAVGWNNGTTGDQGLVFTWTWDRLLLLVPPLLGLMGGPDQQSWETSLLSLTVEGQLCPLHHSSWPLFFEALVQELIQLTGEQLNRALTECLVSKIYKCQGSGPLTRAVLAVRFFLQMPAGGIRDICLQERINYILYSPTW